MRGCSDSALPEENGESSSEQRFIGGCQAGKTAWYVSFALKSLNSTRLARCGGSLINKFWVLSAAHCFCNDIFPCTRLPNGGLQLFIGAEKFITPSPATSHGFSSNSPNKFQFRAVEIIIHPRFNSIVKLRGKRYLRQDHDIALVRLDYPVLDEEFGIGVLKTEIGDGFSKDTIMPICLPNAKVKDRMVKAMAIGFGRLREMRQCLTDDSGPDVFAPCAKRWIGPKPHDQEKTKDNKEYLKYHQAVPEENQDGVFNCENNLPPPSSLDQVCVKFNQKLVDLQTRHKNKELLTQEDRKLLSVYSITKESLLLPTKNLTHLLKEKNLSHCFPTEILELDPDGFGWCATCKLNASRNESGYCDPDHNVLPNQQEIAIPEQNKGWGFCNENCNKISLADNLKMTKLSILSKRQCDGALSVLGNLVNEKMNILTVNSRVELCAAHLNKLNLTVFNYTQETDNRNDFSLFDMKNGSKNKKNKFFRSKRLDNTNLGEFSSKTQLVIGGSDTCQGDSGGPLWVESDLETHNGNLSKVGVLVGIVSRGKGCAMRNYPGIYTRVKSVWKWVRHYADKEQEYAYRFIPYHIQGLPGAPLPSDLTQTFLISPYCRKINITEVAQEKNER
ncbi:uncharacterized protein LOC111718292 isoform X3 [Eurytemora carolleeae]|uniref:uncharacterized protein LOC111718292 isoform X3 n=1 Tax=Eurytemora carolleeae TaxID=1294199 RepID=UPI000C76B64C|nr:uncharacterized protein LOC111718292 isoform X3 [Eurytemora carolleeae]|eukprot:XP_023349609.1 uncharacterized protein LOC111718292 isoform X3 [Eurytemora affinis]